MTDKLREALEREQFEQTMHDVYPHWQFTPNAADGYMREETQAAWLAWQARAALDAPSAGPVAKGALPEFPPFPIWVEANDAEALHAWASQVRREAYEVGAAAGRSAESVGGFELTRSAPIDMVLHCPKCGMQHIDAPELNRRQSGAPGITLEPWDNPPHRSHLCHGCGHIWRPADVPTNGVAAVKTMGNCDSPLATPAQPPAVQAVSPKSPRPYIHHSVCRQSGLQELWLICGDKVLAGPARLPDGWVSLYNIAKMEANMDFSDLDTTAKPQPEPAWVANKAAFDAMEDGQGPYMHRKNLEGGVPVEWPAFKSWAENKLGQGYSLACCEGVLVDSVTSWCFTGFQAGMEYAYETSRPVPGQAAAGEMPPFPEDLRSLILRHGLSYHWEALGDAIRAYARSYMAAAPKAPVPDAWQPIETAPRGSGENGPGLVTHPDYVEPPRLLLWTSEGAAVGAYDWYYHEGYGSGAEPGVPAWRGALTYEPLYGVTHWMPLPDAPKQEQP